MPTDGGDDAADPLFGFRFHVAFYATGGSDDMTLCRGAFSEVSGLEVTMEPFAFHEGGLPWRQRQLVGKSTFSTVVLRRGMTTTRHLWRWFDFVTRRANYAHRLDVVITMRSMANDSLVEWKLKRAMPVKMKLADLNAASQELAVEELHLAHEGIFETVPSSGGAR